MPGKNATPPLRVQESRSGIDPALLEPSSGWFVLKIPNLNQFRRRELTPPAQGFRVGGQQSLPRLLPLQASLPDDLARAKADMKAVAVTPSKREVGIIEHPSPELQGDDEVKIRTIDVGICGTDREICTFVYGDPPSGSDYLVLGHEAMGEVVEVGSEVNNLKVGDFVVPSVRRPCADPCCQPCRADLQDFCSTGEYVERAKS